MSFRRSLTVSAVAALSLVGSAAVAAAPANAASLGSCGKGWPTKEYKGSPLPIKNGPGYKTVGYLHWWVKSYPHSVHREMCVIVRPSAHNKARLMTAGVQIIHKGAYPAERTSKYFVKQQHAISGTFRAYGAITIGKALYNRNGPWQS
ncbi:hypothetical protein GCM10023196_056580 [Actinoallomurus vinaceus]|uniref:Lipoprotein n=1 Tax=Actinoallomurus vinaceus TaxID=1080074 RepID=A0ABP8UI76_9ACTN